MCVCGERELRGCTGTRMCGARCGVCAHDTLRGIEELVRRPLMNRPQHLIILSSDGHRHRLKGGRVVRPLGALVCHNRLRHAHLVALGRRPCGHRRRRRQRLCCARAAAVRVSRRRGIIWCLGPCGGRRLADCGRRSSWRLANCCQRSGRRLANCCRSGGRLWWRHGRRYLR